MAVKNEKVAARLRRKRSVRKRVRGTTERPRLSVFRSTNHIYAQVIDDSSGQTLASASTLDAEVREQRDGKKKTDMAGLVGKLIAQRCLSRQIEKVVFDRNGFIYHGRVKAVADGAREGGLQF
jgi:large subunit ribosomal protein L18